MYKTFMRALAWNSSMTFLYKIFLLMHQILLYSVISKTMYGLQSTLFAGIYVSIALTNFGFEETLLPFFSTYLQSKQNFLQIWVHFIGHIITIAIIALFIFGIMTHGSGEFLHNIQIYCNRNLIFVIALIFFIESIKKSIIAMMQLAFLNKQIAFAEISMLFIYIATVWGIYNAYGQLTIAAIFVPMLITSTVELCYLLYSLLNFYFKLPTNPIITEQIPFKNILIQRIYNYINQITKTMYSPNSMTILFAYLLGFQQAATIKFFTNIITFCYTCISKTIGVTTGATFSAINQMPLPVIRDFFQEITRRYFQMLLILSLLIIIIVGYSWYFSMISGIIASQILLFFTITMLEYVTITYEQLFISQHAAKPLAQINIATFIALIICGYMYQLNIIHYMGFIYLYFCIKIISLQAISFFANKRWAIPFQI
ncbi:MAG: hypothetical protein JO129_01570 [Candidatus Dependentiae bacterium]|nr:hypothetical protein [Candidatus Dependentiae bacterium]